MAFISTMGWNSIIWHVFNKFWNHRYSILLSEISKRLVTGKLVVIRDSFRVMIYQMQHRLLKKRLGFMPIFLSEPFVFRKWTLLKALYYILKILEMYDTKFIWPKSITFVKFWRALIEWCKNTFPHFVNKVVEMILLILRFYKFMYILDYMSGTTNFIPIIF